ncbi:CDGSH iron-sulfur domain-containing protein [Roseateles sp.]|uniref:CDGSH iron-sulfur domain-containing protein n=1 Tax=Roseateles sp. TaxID=1971397 RepID=UPI003BADAEF9
MQDTAKGVSGPLWVRGGVEVVGADGGAYEVRNRVAPCRCGASANKPFCDGAHVASGFTDAH